MLKKITMKRLSLVILFCTTLSAFAFSQNDCRTQDSLMLLKFECAFDFNSGFEWDLELPMDNWYGVSLSPDLPAMTNLPQLLYANVAHNNLDFWDLRKLPNSTSA